MKDTNEIITNAKQLADNLQNTACGTDYNFAGPLWDSAAMLRVLCDKLQDFSTESTALRATEMNLEAEIESLRAQLSQRVPDGCVVADVGFRWDGEWQHYVPKLVVEFEPVPENSPWDAKGWKDRDAVAAMLSAARKEQQ
jgi:hypothetical protein